jgi:hypothetical protein
MILRMDGYVDIASRHSGSIDVTLLWDGAEDKLVVVAHDGLTGEELEIPVDRDHAADVYRHPFAYAAEKSHACAARAAGRAKKGARA